MNNKQLFAGPYVGEFGHEIHCWQAYVRAQSRRYERTYVAAREGHEALYEDFAYRFVPITTTGRPDRHELLHGTVTVMGPRPSGRYDVLRPGKVLVDWSSGAPFVAGQEHVSFDRNRMRQGVVACARWLLSRSPKRNWAKDNWEKLSRQIAKEHREVTSFAGHPDGSASCDTGVNVRSTRVAVLIEILSAAKLAIGPSSGALSMALLTNTPVIVWSGNEKDDSRWHQFWNPFGVEVYFLPTWQPTVQQVMTAVKDMIA